MELPGQRVQTFEASIHIVKWLSEAHTSSSKVALCWMLYFKRSPVCTTGTYWRHLKPRTSVVSPTLHIPADSPASYSSVASAHLVSRPEPSVSSLSASQLVPSPCSMCVHVHVHTHPFPGVNVSIPIAFQPTWRLRHLHKGDRTACQPVIWTALLSIQCLWITWRCCHNIPKSLFCRIIQWSRNHPILSARLQSR